MTKIINAKLDWNESGTPVSGEFDDVYFSNVNGLEETRYVFLQKNQLPERWNHFNQPRFVIGETGFGTGLNFLAAWQAFDLFRQQHPEAPLQSLHFISFEKYPVSKEDLIKAHQAWPELADYAGELQRHYPLAVPECHRITLADGAVTLDLWFGDIHDCMPLVPVSRDGLIDAWFLDGFAPSKNPDMWNQQLFDQMAKLARADATCTTFTAAGFVRRGLIEAGFSMQKVKGFGTKREMLAGAMETPTGFTNMLPWYACHAVPDLSDVAIIGGGIASATLAKALSRRGIRVTLYCQDEKAAQGASGNRQGAIYPLLNAQHDPLSRFFAASFLYARQFVEQMANDGLRFDHQWCGVTQLMWNEQAQKKLKPIATNHFPATLVTGLDAQQTSETIGLPVTSESLYYPLGGWLCPAQLTEQILSTLQSSGQLQPHFRTPIDSLNWDEQKQVWQLHSSEQIFRHQCVVIANGHQYDQLLPSQTLPLAKVKGQVSHIPTTDTLEQLKTVLCYDGYMTPVNPGNQHHCIGASYDRQHIDTRFDPTAQIQNREKLQTCIPDQNWPEDVDVSQNQSRQGIRCVSRDHLPFAGNLGDLQTIKTQYQSLASQTAQSAQTIHHFPHLYGLLGLGSRGLSSAPLLAELLASMMCGDPLPLPVDLLERLHPCRMWVRKLRKGKSVSET
ncbi:bifunctional tRNA (5-methylaminomethyl-2-thiouridine)(34)-methyltransferase MnmD/FAD-dependent 5-carboxymethylaminomethyl-2-thiouridine(34) oxidoreductase MnmC [Vibrio mangrovi]|uniref:tRNA 5-methylaminomethyl-2-thiouridine biosynthesis bifunctional protein MnmC n=1 Tax=Vibrio mangrovi TaxID=474394 RepID=A0A1Y6ITY7_9VIBR|nr:bifunctional tRNA (5-methylaminomethyl-2-thiouridine)(34)-methyltransferase MnmD/FAD-dependent 5-carboxymethylaminomethyl-2-thiouridine(34) oxidoreductase MnmC [Vibrio mangrovi]MDW6001496.1 bifunctional tRNA (5-methylaminomethyl-2-thiouridine)(34)-methyltransferase MnmD/FAD-dependent 5-carboxymethylaminomethyl-2-thiouridine(34) oxidoreductase MnmC [Vibrio mangrovi]SMS00481.1 tRNA 5-methylaminomethyl-2-thiouridine biosynthesis bifunctional protein MnmC [Vibrio mangrovi]